MSQIRDIYISSKRNKGLENASHPRGDTQFARAGEKIGRKNRAIAIKREESGGNKNKNKRGISKAVRRGNTAYNRGDTVADHESEAEAAGEMKGAAEGWRGFAVD